MRCAGAMHYEDVMAHRKSGEWHKQLYSEELNESARTNQAETTKLLVRIRDAEIRGGVERLKQLTSEIAMSKSSTDADHALGVMLGELETINGRIGEVLRKLDDEAGDGR